jgi:hypothetical protein
MRSAIAGIFLAAVGLTACTNKVDGNWVGAGEATESFVNTRVAAAYVPLHAFSIAGMRRGAATIIQSGVAVTNAHNANLVDDADDLGHAPSGEDLMFIRMHEQPIGGAGPLDMADPEVGEEVILYGQGAAGSLRMAQGPVQGFRDSRFTITANAGPGFSGGPVVDAKDGHLVGITFAYYDAPNKKGPREMLAYRISWVMSEYKALKAQNFRNDAKDFTPDSVPK